MAAVDGRRYHPRRLYYLSYLGVPPRPPDGCPGGPSDSVRGSRWNSTLTLVRQRSSAVGMASGNHRRNWRIRACQRSKGNGGEGDDFLGPTSVGSSKSVVGGGWSAMAEDAQEHLVALSSPVPEEQVAVAGKLEIQRVASDKCFNVGGILRHPRVTRMTQRVELEGQQVIQTRNARCRAAESMLMPGIPHWDKRGVVHTHEIQGVVSAGTGELGEDGRRMNHPQPGIRCPLLPFDAIAPADKEIHVEGASNMP